VTIDPEAETPVYQQVAAILRARIGSGEITRRLPSLKSVEQELGVSHGTIERAFAMLRAEGLIRPVIGRGYFVVPLAER
jgi:GntR family transcriptional regulator